MLKKFAGRSLETPP